MNNLKFSGLMLMLLATILVLSVPTINAQCLRSGAPCQPNGSMGNCCRGICWKEVGWTIGHCQWFQSR